MINYSKKMNVSVVIATLGGPSLKKAILHLNNGTVVPKEILICIPESYSNNLIELEYPNTIICKTKVSGQVEQRTYGFNIVNYHYVLQIDDDVFLSKNCLRELIDVIGHHENRSACPTLLDVVTNKPTEFLSSPSANSNYFDKFIFWIINGKKGYQSGKISKAGLNMAHSINNTDNYEVDWLPGGCALHIKQNLVLNNYYPYEGKAFSEDVLHSFILKKNGIKLFHCSSATCMLDNTSSKGEGVYSLIKVFISIIRINFYIVVRNKKSLLRMILFIPIYYLNLIFKKYF